MKRFHVHVHVDDLAKSIASYSKMFAAECTPSTPRGKPVGIPVKPSSSCC